YLALEGQVGWLVRDSSPIGSATQEPDGSSSGQCQIFAPQSGEFIAYASCPQREEAAPPFGAALATHGLHWLGARTSYRRSVSRPVLGLAAGTVEETPRWGVLEEKLSAEARGNILDGAIVPWAAARWNLLLGLVDEAPLGVRLACGEHALTA